MARNETIRLIDGDGRPADDFQLTRMTFDLLRPIGFGRLTRRTEVDGTGNNVIRAD